MRYTWAAVVVSLAAAVTVTTALSTGAAAAPDRQDPYHHRPLPARADFRHGTGQWSAELEKGGNVTARDGVLDVDVPAGASVWFKRPFSGRYEIDTARSGALADTTTRLRRYVGVAGSRPLIHDYTAEDPSTSGWSAFRTTWSHFHLTDFRVWRLEGGHDA